MSVTFTNNEVVVGQYECYCGKHFIKVNDVSKLYNNCGVICDQCHKKSKANDIVWHCDGNNIHKYGFDICNHCIHTYDIMIFRDKFMPNHIQTVRVLNVDENESTIQSKQLLLQYKPDYKSYIISNYDEQLIILIKFQQIINIHLVELYSLPNTVDYIKNNNDNEPDLSAPKQVLLYKIDDIDKQFEDIKSLKSDQSIVTASSIISFNNVSQKMSKFAAVQHLAIYIVSNQNDTENTYLNAIKIKSTLASPVNIKTSNKQRQYKYESKTSNSRYLLNNNSSCNLSQCASMRRLNITLSRYRQFMTRQQKGDYIQDETQNQTANVADNDTKAFVSTISHSDNENAVHDNECKTDENNDNKNIVEKVRNMVSDIGKKVERHRIDPNIQLKMKQIAKQKMTQQIRIYALSHPGSQNNVMTEFVATLHKYQQQIIAMKKNAIESAQKITSGKTVDIIYDPQSTGKMIENLYDADYTNIHVLNDFHHLLFVHDGQFEKIYDLLIQHKNDGPCNLNNCLMFRRNRRDRSLKDDAKLREMYFNLDNGYDIVQQQLLDKIHCHYFHSFDVGNKLTKTEVSIMQNIITNDEEFEDQKEMKQSEETNDYNKVIQKIHEINKPKKQSYSKITGINENGKVSKFSTKIEGNNYKLRYSNGMRYFYWDYYRTRVPMYYLDIASNSCVARQSSANEGYMLADWYIVPLFQNLKDEILNNSICVITSVRWNVLIQKADFHLATNCAKAIFSMHPMSETIYGIPKGTPISISHLIAMMLYCNNDVLQAKFSETYRRIPSNETDEDLINRHRNYTHLGRLLRENVDCFGAAKTYIEFRNLRLYHGISIQANFSSSIVSFKGPVSTSTDYAVAANFCANSGAILELNLDPNWAYSTNIETKGMAMFECFWLSDYPNEQERFFIGGYSKFTIITIILAPIGTDYSAYIAALNTLFFSICNCGAYNTNNMLSGNKEDTINQICFRILSDKLHSYYPNDTRYHSFDSLPKYVRTLINAHFNDIKKLQLFARDDAFIEKLMKSLFFYDYGWTNLDKLITVFPSLEKIEFECKQTDTHFINNKSIYLSILSYLKINSNTKLKHFIIAFPYKDNCADRAAVICQEFAVQFNRLKYLMFVNDTTIDFGSIQIQIDGDELETNYIKFAKSRIASKKIYVV